MPAARDSKRYSPDALVLELRVAPVPLLVTVTSAPETTACDLSVTVPCSVAVEFAWPNRLMQLRSSRLLMATIVNNFLLLIEPPDLKRKMKRVRLCGRTWILFFPDRGLVNDRAKSRAPSRSLILVLVN